MHSCFFFFSSRRRHTRSLCDWSSDVCSSDLERCLADPELNHPFSHHVSPRHTENLAAYWAEVFGGPPRYSSNLGGHSGMLSIHAGEGAPEEMGDRFEACFVQAMDDARLPDDREFRKAMRD